MERSRNLADAVVPLQQAFAHLKEQWPLHYPDAPVPVVTETYRSNATQRAYFAQGRESLATVNALRRVAKLEPISEARNKGKVTNAKPGQSKHNVYPSKAVDLAFARPDGTLDWREPLFKQAAAIIREAYPQIVWGGDWDSDGRSDDERFIDRPHFEVK